VIALWSSSLQATAATYLSKLVLLSSRSLASQQPCVRHAGLRQGHHRRRLSLLAFIRTPPPAMPRTAFLVAIFKHDRVPRFFFGAQVVSLKLSASLCVSVRQF
jgi:hypothetical protein